MSKENTEKSSKNTMNFDKNRIGTGTREWAEHSYNIAKGCKHNCVYCYARANSLRFKTINNKEEWSDSIVNIKKVNKKWKKEDGIIMFPTTHDITIENINECLTTLTNMLSVGNSVLIVSKPCIKTIDILTEGLKEYKENILFRFTIGNINDNVLKVIEPGAPSFNERLGALKLAYEREYRTSVSIEPLLGGIKEAKELYDRINTYITDSIWIGKMNKIDERVFIDSKELASLIDYIRAEQVDEKIKEIYEAFNNNPMILWKDSIKEVMAKYSA